MDENSLHDSGIKPEYLPTCEKCPHNKAMYLCSFSYNYQAQIELLFVPSSAKNICMSCWVVPIVNTKFGLLMCGQTCLYLSRSSHVHSYEIRMFVTQGI